MNVGKMEKIASGERFKLDSFSIRFNVRQHNKGKTDVSYHANIDHRGAYTMHIPWEVTKMTQSEKLIG
jgi:hypothetical protein